MDIANLALVVTAPYMFACIVRFLCDASERLHINANPKKETK